MNKTFLDEILKTVAKSEKVEVTRKSFKITKSSRGSSIAGGSEGKEAGHCCGKVHASKASRRIFNGAFPAQSIIRGSSNRQQSFVQFFMFTKQK